MPLTGLNHITLACNDIERSLTFYREVLGFTAHVKWNQGAYLSLADVWLCLSLDEPDEKRDYTHIAFSLEARLFDDFAIHLEQHAVPQWKINQSEGESLYILDPDGHKLEVHSGDLQSRLSSLKQNPYEGLVWLDSMDGTGMN